ncbi:MAG TPA: zinc ribbon domain-containing protein [Pyrinomonadaceae bacterium]|jgi:hypothetical protein|nr:zinc ribbon domain-containing protein [Pyrinomonadaceae bacterium]
MTVVECPQCGTSNPLAAEVCFKCGAELNYLVPPIPASPQYRPPLSYAEPEVANEEFPLAAEIGPFTGVGSALSPTISICKDNFWLIAKVVFVLFAPLEIFKALSFGQDQKNLEVGLGLFCLGLFCKVLVAPSLIYALVNVMRTGTAPGLHDTYRFGLSKLVKVIPTAGMAWVLQVLGYICLVIPGIIIGLAFELILPIVVLENLSPVETLKRSWNLTKGHRLNIFLSGLVLGLLLGVVSIPASLLTAFLPLEGLVFAMIRAAASLITDILSEATTVMSLVIYFGILKSHGGGFGGTALSTPPPPPAFE